MTSWLSAFVARFTRRMGRPPNPLELAHNLPKDMSDSEAMLSMVKWMEEGPSVHPSTNLRCQLTEPEPTRTQVGIVPNLKGLENV